MQLRSTYSKIKYTDKISLTSSDSEATGSVLHFTECFIKVTIHILLSDLTEEK